jgi:RNA polymerase II-associated protein 3
MDAFKVQAQIRQNATEMQDFLKDLGSWEKNIKQRDRFVQSFQLALGYLRDLC